MSHLQLPSWSNWLPTAELAYVSTESGLLYDWRFTANQFVLASSPLRLTTSNIIFQLNTCGYSPYVTFSLSRGCVCRLLLPLVLARAVSLRSESRGTHDHILLCQIRDSPTWRPRFPYLYTPGTGWPGYTPRHWVEWHNSPCTTDSLSGHDTHRLENTSTTVLLLLRHVAIARTAKRMPLPIVVALSCCCGIITFVYVGGAFTWQRIYVT
jgi:hypothetical protein